MARKRVQTSPDEMGQVPKRKSQSSPQFSISAGANGATAVGPSAGAQMVQALAKFNPALQAFGQTVVKKRDATAEAGAMSYLEELEKGVSDHSVVIKKHLKDAGASQWNNYYIYRNAIVNNGANFAERDARKLEGNQELQQQLHALSKTTDSANFEADAREIIERGIDSEGNPFFPLERNVEKGAEKYWEYGYGPAWITARDNLIAPHLKAFQQTQQTETHLRFFERGRTILSSLVTGKEGEWTKNFKEFRKFVSHQYGGYPDQDLGYSQAVFDNIITPVFEDLAKNPDNDIQIQAALSKVLTMTRDDPKTGGRVQLWKKQQDLSRQDGIQSIDAIRLSMQEMEDRAAKYQSGREALIKQGYVDKIAPVLKHWKTLKEEEEYKSIFQETGVYTVEDIQDHRNWPLLVTSLLKHPDFDNQPKDVSEAATRRVLWDSIEKAKTSLQQLDVDKYKTKGDFQAAILTEMQSIIAEDNADMFDQFLPSINNAIGSTAATKEEVLANIMKSLDPVKMEQDFWARNPSLPRNAIPYMDALKGWVAKAYDPLTKAAARGKAHVARAYLKANASTQDLIAQKDILEDAVLEVDDQTIDKELNSIVSELDKAIDLKPYLTISSTDMDDLLQQGLTKIPNAQVDEIIALASKNPTVPDQNAVPNQGGPDTSATLKAQQVMMSIKDKATAIYREEVRRALRNIEPAARKAFWQDEGGDAEARKRTVERLSGMQNELLQQHQQLTTQQASHQAGVSKTHLGRLAPPDQDRLTDLSKYESQFLWDEETGVGTRPLDEVMESPSVMLEFTAGPEGQRRFERLHALKQERATEKTSLGKKLYEARGQLTKRLTDGSSESAIALAQDKVEEREREYKAHHMAFEGLDWRKLGDADGYQIEIPKVSYDPDGGKAVGFTITLNPNVDPVSMETTLIYTSPFDMEATGEMLNTWEAKGGGWTAEIDPETAPDDLKLHAKVIQKMQGFNILASEPNERANAHRQYSSLNKKQFAMLYTRQPEKMGHIHDAYEDQAVRQFADPQGGYEKWQGEEYTENEKEWLQATIEQRDDIIAGDYDTEKGITGPQATKLVGQLVGGMDNLGTSKYELLDEHTSVGRRSKEVASLEEVIAEQMALTLVGIQNPITLDETQKQKNDEVYWSRSVEDFENIWSDFWRDEGAESRVLPGDIWGVPYTRLTAEKYERLKTETKRITSLMKSGMPSPELAQLYNRLVAAEGDYFENKYNRKNAFGVQPLLIPLPTKNEPYHEPLKDQPDWTVEGVLGKEQPKSSELKP